MLIWEKIIDNIQYKNNRMYLQIYNRIDHLSMQNAWQKKQQQNFHANALEVYWYSLFHKVGLWYVKAMNYKPWAIQKIRL